ncbi:ABC transporter substrate-binding protein [Bradyrhizobium sp. CB82]|uniref:ABC transporter substrate-binding protein n=1 Tax=Bradyrhizobium sp. CB82 TaxID=3039159 RepID=UPI0024B0F6B5|nr:ABC transporter substrate-binding protein [Bradyrhizobium sp. CB82]WFU40002.1 ABC transporter substrate-binding protein [Bradyrhizobium sp. CB82]
MSFNEKPDLLRRRLVRGAGATFLSGVIAAPMIARKAFASGNLVVVSWGGAYRRSVEEAWVKPFEKEYGISVTLVDTPDLAKVKAQVMTNQVQWDVFDAPGAITFGGSKNGYWELLDPTLVKRDDLITPMTKDAVPSMGFAGGIGWDKNKFPDGKHPETFTDYFDFEKFPGPRTLRNRPSETLEVALLADGVAPEKLYPLDVDRAFRSLDRIKPYILNWVEQTPQTVTLLKTGEVNFSFTYPSQVIPQNASGSLGFSFKQNLFGFEYLAVLKNAPNRDNAMKYLQFVLRPDRQAAIANTYLGIMPTSRAAVPLLTSEARKWQPFLENKLNVSLNDMWWSDQYEEVTRRFKEWQLS